MIRSQIKLTPYDFSDLQITGEFDNRPGTGRFLSFFSCVVTYCTGAARRLYMITVVNCFWRDVIRRRRDCVRFSLRHFMYIVIVTLEIKQ